MKLILVTWADQIHLYGPEQGEVASIVYTVAIGANYDALIKVLTVEQWERVRASLGLVALLYDIWDHRR